MQPDLRSESHILFLFCTQIFTAALFVIGPNWKQAKIDLSTRRRVDKRIVVNPSDGVYYPAIKRNRIVIRTAQVNLKIIVLNAKSQTEKGT